MKLFFQTWKSRWLQMQLREQRLVLGLLVTALIGLVYFLTVPVGKAVLKLEAGLVTQQANAAKVSQVLEQIKRLKNQPAAAVLSAEDQRKQVAALLTQLNLKPREPNWQLNEQGLQISFESADYGAVLTWIQMLHTQLQLRVSKAGVQALGQGKVNIELQLIRVQNTL